MRALHRRLLEAWNRRDADGLGASFAEDGLVVGFDGSQQVGRGQIVASMAKIFADHPTGAYVWKVRSVREIAPDVARLHAVVGMIPAGASELAPALNAVQTLIAIKRGGNWEIDLFQNTPAQLHGRPQAART